MNEATYLYGFVPGGTELPAEGLLGIDDRAVELLDVGAFRAAVTRVPAERYGPAALEPRLKELRWVAEQGVRHEQVVAWFLDHAEILPVRLFTLYSSDAALAESAVERAERIELSLRRFAGLREWDLKVSYHAERLAAQLGRLSDDVAALDRSIAEAQPGRRFLLEKKRADVVRREVSRTARRLAVELLDEVRGEAEEVVLPPLPRGDAELPVVLSAALLLDTAAGDRVRERIRPRAAELAGRGIDVEFSGPWAPYRFLGMDDAGDAPAPVRTG